MLALLFVPLAAAAPEIVVVGRRAGWSVRVTDRELTMAPLYTAEVASEAAAQALVARLQQCNYPAPGAKAGTPCPHMCLAVGVPCPGSSDPGCERMVLIQNGDKPGNRTELANVTAEYSAALGRLTAPDGYIISRLPSARVQTLLYCECPDEGKWNPDERRSYACERPELDEVMRSGKCGASAGKAEHADKILVLGRSRGGWSAALIDEALSPDPLWVYTAANESAAQAAAARMKQCRYPSPDGKDPEHYLNLCYRLPCGGGAKQPDPSCTTDVILQSGESYGNITVLANVTAAYVAVLGGLGAADGYVIAGLAAAAVEPQLYCECADDKGWFPGKQRSYICERDEFDRVAKTGKCESKILVV